MHSMTTASGFSCAKKRIRRTCSPMDAERNRWIMRSFPCESIIRGAVPVVLANVRTPPARRPAAIKRVTLDLPRVPLTWIRSGIASKLRWCCQNSIAPINRRMSIRTPRMYIGVNGI